MHVLVTGAAGFIGSHTCERLIAGGHRVTGLDAFNDFVYPAAVKRANARELTGLPRDRFRLVEGSISDPDAVATALDHSVDVVCHLAALPGVRPSLEQPLRYLRTNIEGTGVILERMRELTISRMVFASSSSVYGSRESGAVFREDDPCLRPSSPYAATKRMNELQLATYCDLYGLGVIALRYFTVYGPRQRPDMAIHKFMRAIARGEQLEIYGDGSSLRDYTFVDDIVAGTVAAIERVVPRQFDIFNLGNSTAIELRELVAAIERIVGKPATIVRRPPQPGDVPLTRADISRARAALDYAPATALDAGLERAWRWFQQRQDLTAGSPAL